MLETRLLPVTYIAILKLHRTNETFSHHSNPQIRQRHLHARRRDIDADRCRVLLHRGRKQLHDSHLRLVDERHSHRCRRQRILQRGIRRLLRVEQSLVGDLERQQRS